MIKDNKKTVFLTGATGLVGSYLLKVLLQEGHKVYVLARGKDNKGARDRVVDILKFWDKNVIRKKSHNLRILEGDITEKKLGLKKQNIALLTNEIDEIFHSAAVTQYNWPLEKIRKVNVEGTKNVLKLALKCSKEGPLKKINHISTAYVCGDYKGVFKEDDLDVGQKFNSTYEQSKFEAEKLIHDYRNYGLWVDIFRPSVVVGESTTGKIPLFQQHFYQVLHVWNLGIFDYFPIKDYFANIVPADELSRSIITISTNTSIKNGNYHVFNSRKIPLENVLISYKNFFRVKKPKAVSSGQLSKLYLTPSQKIILKNLFFTFNGYVKLDSRMTERLLIKYGFTFSKINEGFFYKTFEYLTWINF